MAQVQNPIIGRSSGKFDNMVFNSFRSSKVIKTHCPKIHVSDLPQSSLNRLFLREAPFFLKNYKQFFTALYANSTPLLNWYAASFKDFRSLFTYSGGAFLFNPYNKKLGSGPLTPIYCTDFSFIGNAKISIKWCNDQTNPDITQNDLLFFIYYPRNFSNFNLCIIPGFYPDGACIYQMRDKLIGEELYYTNLFRYNYFSADTSTGVYSISEHPLILT